MEDKRVMTAPLAIIQINSVTVGKMKNVRITENIRRGRVAGVGQLNPSELPALEWQGQMSCSSYTINFNLLANKLKKGTFRNAGSLESWANAILLQEDADTGLVATKYENFAKVNGAFATREGFDLQEGQISGRDTDFEYLEPILYNDVV